MFKKSMPLHFVKRQLLLLSACLSVTAAMAYNDYDGEGSCTPTTVNEEDSRCYTMTPPLIAEQPIIDGSLTESAWSSASVIVKSIGRDEFVIIDGGIEQQFVEHGEMIALRGYDDSDNQVIYLALKIFGGGEGQAETSDFLTPDYISLYLDPAPQIEEAQSDFLFQISRDPGRVQVRPNDGGDLDDVGDSGDCALGSAFCTVTTANSQFAIQTQTSFTIAGDPQPKNGWIIEMRIASSDLGAIQGLPSLPQVLGLGVRTNNALQGGTVENYIWPQHNMGDVTNEDGDFEYEVRGNWGALKTRYNIDKKVVVDRSGSMRSSLDVDGETTMSRYEASELATNYLINFMSIFSDRNYFEDQLEVYGFTTPSGGAADEFSIVNLVWEDSGAQVVPSVEDIIAIDGFFEEFDDETPMNLTPIAAGMNAAFSDLGVLGAEEDYPLTEKFASLMGDGLHNRQFSQMGMIDPNGVSTPSLDRLAYDPCSRQPQYDTASTSERIPLEEAQWEPCESSVVTVNTVFLSTSGVDTPEFGRMNNISSHYNGNALSENGQYSTTNSITELKRVLIASLENVYQFNNIYTQTRAISDAFDPINGEFSLESGNAKLIVIAGWNGVNGDSCDPESPDEGCLPEAISGFSVTSGTETETVSCTQSGTLQNVGISFCVIDAPLGGDYSISNSAAINDADDLFVLVDLILDAKPDIDTTPIQAQTSHTVGFTINYAGLPFVPKGKASAEVKVIVDQPGTNIGSLVSALDERCELLDIWPYDPDPIVVPQVAYQTQSPLQSQMTSVYSTPLNFKALQPINAAYSSSSSVLNDAMINPLYDKPLPKIPLQPIDIVDNLVERCKKYGKDIFERSDREYIMKYQGNGYWSVLIDGFTEPGVATYRFEVRGTTQDGEAWQRQDFRMRTIEPKIEIGNTVENLELVNDDTKFNGKRAWLYRHALLVLDSKRFPIGLGLEGRDLNIAVKDAFNIGNLQFDRRGIYYRDIYMPFGVEPKVDVFIDGQSVNQCEFFYTSYFDFYGTYFTGIVRVNNPTDEVIQGWELEMEFSNDQKLNYAVWADLSGDNPYVLSPNHFLTKEILPNRWVDVGVAGFAPLGIIKSEQPEFRGDVCKVISTL